MIEIDRYVDLAGNCPYDEWVRSLERNVKARIIEALGRVEEGNLSMIKSVGQGVFELRLHFGPGYRVYCGKDGDRLVILLGGGNKRRQQDDIEGAQSAWRDYKARKTKLSR
jgi:putative addiction module killer protein